MNILIVNNTIIPVSLYGGTERVIWYLGKELVKLGHNVTYLVAKGSTCEFAHVIPLDKSVGLAKQIPEYIDLVHFNFIPENLNEIRKPYLITLHGNVRQEQKLDLNTVFVSKNHAERYGSSCFVYNGLDWDDYVKPQLAEERKYFHFLGNAAWRLKNVKGAIQTVLNTKSERLKVLGGVRFNVRMGIRFTFSPRISFHGMVGGANKDHLLNGSKGLIFPVLWHEPFGLAILESLYFGCPVFGTPYGSLPEIVQKEFGLLSCHLHELTNALAYSDTFNKKRCHEYALSEFNSKKMAEGYLEKYTRVLSNEKLNPIAPQSIVVQKDKFLAWKE